MSTIYCLLYIFRDLVRHRPSRRQSCNELLSFGHEFILTVSGGTRSDDFIQDRHSLLIIMIRKEHTIAIAKRTSKGEGSLTQIWSVLPRHSQALDNLIQWLIWDPQKLSQIEFRPNYIRKNCDGVSGDAFGRIRGEEFMAEDCHLLNILHHVSSFQLHLKGQRMHEQCCDGMAREPECLVRLVSKMAEVFGCINGIVRLLGLCRARKKRESEEEQRFKDHCTVF